ncbi:MAG: glycosyltransferase family 4 protein [Patescibacteria group bacterium]
MPQKKKILYVITQGAWGGAQRYVYDLATHLTEEFDITVAVGEPNGGKKLLDKLQITNYKLQINNKIQTIQLKHLVRRISPIDDILAIFELRKLYKTLKPDIIHLNSSKAGIIGSLAKCLMLRASCIMIYTVHGWVFNEPLPRPTRWLYQIMERITSRWKNKIIVLSEQDKQTALQQLKINEKKLALIPLGIDQPNFLSREEARQKLLAAYSAALFRDTVSSDIWIGTIAGLYKTKGLDTLIKAVVTLNNLQSSIFNLQFFIIGSGPEKENLQSAICNLQLTNVHLLGFIENAQEFLPAFDFFVLPSRKEGLPYTLLEAKMAGTPIIATDAGGVSEIIEDKKTGLLVPPENIEKLAQALLFACNNQEKMKQFAECGSKKDILKYSKQTMVKDITALYQSLVR